MSKMAAGVSTAANASGQSAIIAAVKAKPQLWNSKHADRTNRLLTQQLWQTTANDLGLDVDTLKSRWKHIKDHYRCEVRRPKSTWRHFNLLDFLHEEVTTPQRRKKKRRFRNVVDEERHDAEEIDYIKGEVGDEVQQFLVFNHVNPAEDAVEEDKPNASFLQRKHIVQALEEGSTGGNDEDYLYFMSILPIMKKMDVSQRLRLRGRINHFLLVEMNANSKKKKT